MDMEKEVVKKQPKKHHAITSFSTVINCVNVNFKKGDEVKASKSILEFFIKIKKIK